MHLLKANKSVPINLDDTTINVKAGHKYIIPDHLALNFQNTPTEFCELTMFGNQKELTQSIDFTGKRLLVNRTGGIGDFFFICRSLYEIKKNFKNVFIEFACAPRYQAAISTFMMPHIVDKSSSIIIPYPSYEMCDYFITFEGFLEDTKEASQVNAFELIGKKKFFIDVAHDHTVPITIPAKAEEQASEILKQAEGKIIIGIQIRATAMLRTYPFYGTIELIRQLLEKNYAIVLIDKAANVEEFKVYANNNAEILKQIIFPYTNTIKGSLALSAALVKKCDLLIAPDSALIYVADSVGVPVIGLYSPVSSILRATGLNVYALDVRGGCYNCYRHGTSGCPWSNDGWSCCLKRISPKNIADLTEKIINEHSN